LCTLYPQPTIAAHLNNAKSLINSHNLNLYQKMKKTISKLQPSAIMQWLLCAVILLSMANNSNAQVCTANAGSAITICAGTTTGPLGGSFGGGATSAVWSDGGAGGTFSNNDGSTPGTATYTPSSGAFGSVTLTLSATGACEATSSSKTVTVNQLHSNAAVAFYNYSCDRNTEYFSNTSQTFTAPFSGYITQINAGIGLWMTGTSYGTEISTVSHTINYGTLGYSGRCCYSMCTAGNNMASTTLPTPFYVVAGEAVTINFTGGGGERHYEGGILRMYIVGHPLVSGTTITPDGATSFCAGGSVNLDAGNFASYNWTPSGNTQTINATATGNYSVVVSDVNGCSASASQSVSVGSISVGVNVSPSASVLTGTSVTLSGTGASSYSWSGGITDGVSFTATATNTYTVTGTDGSGCTGTATQTITVIEEEVDNEPPTISCPGNIVINAADGLCSAAVTFSVTATDNVIPPSSSVQDQGSPDGGAITNTKISYWQSFTAGISGQLTGVAVEGWWTNGSTGYTLNIFSGDGIGGTLLYSQSGIVLPNSGYGLLDILQLSPGVTLVAGQQYTWNLTNGTGFRLICYPWASYAGGRGDEYQSQPGWGGFDYRFATYMMPAGVTIVSTPPSGSSFNVGTTTVNNVATDAAGNTSTCSFTVTVVDNQPPVLSGCQEYNVTLSACTPTYTWTEPTATDNCSGVSVTRTGPAPGSTFDNGSTVLITYTATDAAGNSSSCSFTVSRTSALTATASSSNPLIFYGYAFDQVSPITVSASGGNGTLNYAWSMSRGLNCNVTNSAGDELLSGGWNVACACTTSNCTTPVASYSGTSFTAKLTSDANFTVVVTDADQCTAASTVHIDAIDARCIAGNSGNPKVQICHHTGSSSNPYVTLCVSQDAVAELLAQGDCIGSCSSYSNPMICSGYRAEATEEIMMVETQFSAYPNPFTGSTTIAFSVPKDGNTVIRVFNSLGEQINVLFDGEAKSGTINKVEFDGSSFPSGIYFYSITANGMNETKRMQIIK
jgi:hypothetical protein